jgi:CsoR family transcriptional regulator, copper-sensing transcriptional repressor
MTNSLNTSGTADPGYAAAGAKDGILKRLRRVEGQVRGIAGMVEEDRYCLDVLQQISAAQAALEKVALALVDEHTRHCVLGAAPENQEEMRAELMTALTRLVGRR